MSRSPPPGLSPAGGMLPLPALSSLSSFMGSPPPPGDSRQRAPEIGGGQQNLRRNLPGVLSKAGAGPFAGLFGGPPVKTPLTHRGGPNREKQVSAPADREASKKMTGVSLDPTSSVIPGAAATSDDIGGFRITDVSVFTQGKKGLPDRLGTVVSLNDHFFAYATASDDGRLRVIDRASAATVVVRPITVKAALFDMSFRSSDENVLVTLRANGEVCVWKLSTLSSDSGESSVDRQLIGFIAGSKDPSSRTVCTRWHSSGSLVTVDRDNVLQLWHPSGVVVSDEQVKKVVGKDVVDGESTLGLELELSRTLEVPSESDEDDEGDVDDEVPQVDAVEFSKDDSLLLFALSGMVCVARFPSMEIVSSVALEDKGVVADAQFLSQGFDLPGWHCNTIIAVGSDGGRVVRLFDVSKSEGFLIQTLKFSEAKGRFTMRVDPTGSFLFVSPMSYPSFYVCRALYSKDGSVCLDEVFSYRLYSPVLSFAISMERSSAQDALEATRETIDRDFDLFECDIFCMHSKGCQIRHFPFDQFAKRAVVKKEESEIPGQLPQPERQSEVKDEKQPEPPSEPDASAPSQFAATDGHASAIASPAAERRPPVEAALPASPLASPRPASPPPSEVAKHDVKEPLLPAPVPAEEKLAAELLDTFRMFDTGEGGRLSMDTFRQLLGRVTGSLSKQPAYAALVADTIVNPLIDECSEVLEDDIVIDYNCFVSRLFAESKKTQAQVTASPLEVSAAVTQDVKRKSEKLKKRPRRGKIEDDRVPPPAAALPADVVGALASKRDQRAKGDAASVSDRDVDLLQAIRSMNAGTEQRLMEAFPALIKSAVSDANKGMQRQIDQEVARMVQEQLKVVTKQYLLPQFSKLLVGAVSELASQVSSKVISSIRESFNASFEQFLVPSCERAMGEMCNQLNGTVSHGLAVSFQENLVKIVEDTVTRAQSQSLERLRLDVERSLEEHLRGVTSGGSGELGAGGVPSRRREMREIDELLSLGEFNEAFQRARDVELVMHACTALRPSEFFAVHPFPLTQPVLLSLLLLLGHELTRSTAIKLEWMREVVLWVNPKDDSIANYASERLAELLGTLERVYPTFADTTGPFNSSLKIIMHVVNSLMK